MVSSSMNMSAGDGRENDDDLYTTALRFLLLRQQGFKVSCDMFDKFKEVDGKFEESLGTDAVGLLTLFETTHVRVHGEDLLDEALTFTTTHLESSIEAHRLSPLEARSYLSIYEERGHSVNQTLLTFAKLDFNLLQQVH
ncbi:terpene synthase [Pyrus ussuriensis x Pyrus communis]|uniref:Terpene synthase n=1 Tax=Pyrus ussuriensis x Pyrus communis TaxID=2448454 RepID=A0A5N5FRJ3_9ROSA|nr:terpene synthase [Pyrus ussuriensis x Pyrus communis]